MKKKTLILAVLMAFSGIAFAAGDGREGINQRTQHSFNTDFRNVSDVSWTETGTCFKVTFRSDGQTMFAYYDKIRAELIAVTRNLSSDALPLNLRKGLQQRLAGSWVTELFEVAGKEETSYFLSLEDRNGTMLFKSNGTVNWELVNRSAK